jgi:hypothetical protein
MSEPTRCGPLAHRSNVDPPSDERTALDRSALAGGVAALEDDVHTVADRLDVALSLEQLDLERSEIALVLALVDGFVLRQVVLHLVDRLDRCELSFLGHGSSSRRSKTNSYSR